MSAASPPAFLPPPDAGDDVTPALAGAGAVASSDRAEGRSPEWVDQEWAGDGLALLDVRIRFTPSLPVVRLSGELDVASVHLLTDAVDALTAAHCPAELVLLDLTGVTFCDVAGLRGIERCGVDLRETGRDLLLYHVPTCVERLIRLTGLAGALDRR